MKQVGGETNKTLVQVVFKKDVLCWFLWHCPQPTTVFICESLSPGECCDTCGEFRLQKEGLRLLFVGHSTAAEKVWCSSSVVVFFFNNCRHVGVRSSFCLGQIWGCCWDGTTTKRGGFSFQISTFLFCSFFRRLSAQGGAAIRWTRAPRPSTPLYRRWYTPTGQSGHPGRAAYPPSWNPSVFSTSTKTT